MKKKCFVTNPYRSIRQHHSNGYDRHTIVLAWLRTWKILKGQFVPVHDGGDCDLNHGGHSQGTLLGNTRDTVMREMKHA